MRGVPRRFLVVYVVAFGLLWGLGVFVETRSTYRNALRFPWESRAKISQHWVRIEAYVLEGVEGGPTQYIVINDSHDDNPPYPDIERSTRERILGVVSVWWRRNQGVVAPLVSDERDYIAGEYYSFENRTVRAEDFEIAKSILYEEARLWFDTEHFRIKDLKVHGFDMSSDARVDWVFAGREFHPAMPWWVMIALFAFAPVLTAWTVTAATTRRKPGAR